MALRALLQNHKPGTPPPAPAAQGPATGLDVAAIQNSARELQIAQAQAAEARKQAEEYKRAMEAANAERDRVAIKNEILSAAGLHKALNAEHVFALHSDKFILHNGKVVSKSDPSKGVGDVLKEFFEKEGKYLVSPSIPGGGSGAPGTMVSNQAPPPDLETKSGLTAVTRGITHKLFGPKGVANGQPQTPQGAPVQPAAAPAQTQK